MRSLLIIFTILSFSTLANAGDKWDRGLSSEMAHHLQEAIEHFVDDIRSETGLRNEAIAASRLEKTVYNFHLDAEITGHHARGYKDDHDMEHAYGELVEDYMELRGALLNAHSHYITEAGQEHLLNAWDKVVHAAVNLANSMPVKKVIVKPSGPNFKVTATIKGDDITLEGDDASEILSACLVNSDLIDTYRQYNPRLDQMYLVTMNGKLIQKQRYDTGKIILDTDHHSILEPGQIWNEHGYWKSIDSLCESLVKSTFSSLVTPRG